MANRMQNLNIKSSDEVVSLNQFLHDEHVVLSDIKYDSNTLEIPFRRMFHYNTPPRIIKNYLLYKIGEVDLLRCRLRIHKVKKYEIRDKAKIGDYSFDGIEYDLSQRSLKIVLHEDCIINIDVDDILIEYSELEFKGKGRITYGLFWESSDSKIYE